MEAANPDAGAGPPICVLGMGRSGTSLATRALNLLGVDLGPEERMLAANDWNPTGFWEQSGIMSINDEILAAFGGSYEQPPDLPDGWHRDARLAGIRRQMAELVAELFADGRRWAFKDPRTVTTLALWQDVVGDMAYVVCARDPFEATASHRVGFPGFDADHFLGLWLRSNAAALRQTRGLPRVVVLYDEWFRHPEAVALRLHGLLDGDGAPVPPEALAAIRASVDPALHRQRADLGSSDGAPLEIRSMWMVLAALTGRDDEPHLASLGDLEREWHERRARDEAEAAARAAAAEEARRLAGELERLQGELARTAQALDVVSSSRSWRLTAPLRTGALRLRRLRR